VQIAASESLRGIERYEGYIPSEAEVGLELTPDEFAALATYTIPASVARSILADMGIRVPTRIPLEDLSRALLDTPKLTSAQIDEFVRRAAEYE
jgi:hypothetical protein